ncbi:hypothetical protein FND36_10285 [Lachnospiraceae bacterium KGMB03038]|nr:hypothetical protein FND36_10285 [Lachnospiraceae bacterium KGMB03038]
MTEGLMFPKPGKKKRRKKHGKPLIFTESGRCFLCEAEGIKKHQETERHHVLYGAGQRTISEAEGFVVDLCPYHHRTGPKAVHNCRETREYLCRLFQAEYEKTHTRAEWMEKAGRNYLE